MAIDKIIPIRLDKSSDFKLVPTTSMVDALNMLITENDSSGDNGSTGNLGVLKNIKGNDPILYLSGHNIAVGNAKIIGSVTDTKLKIVYFFVWHTIASEHGVYAYDQIGKLPISGSTKGKIVRIHKSALYAFPEHGYVKGNIIYTSQTRLDDSEIKPGAKKDFEKDAILYFTDNTNEPRKLNVYQAMLGADSEYSDADLIDFITACPRTPLTPIRFSFSQDTNISTSNFKSGPGFQFAYQFISKDGVESAISPYSDIAFSPGVINQGTSTSINHALHNKCELTIPVAGEEIESVRILARQFNNPELVILDEVSNIDLGVDEEDNWDASSRIYSFYNNRIVRGVSNNEVNKQFDNLPRKAQAQSVVDNRLMYGNYLEGFDSVKARCSATVSFRPRDVEFLDFELKIVPAISEQQFAAAVTYDPGSISEADSYGVSAFQIAGARNKSAGYILDASQLPDEISAGTFIDISLSVSPTNNFHVYQATKSYHQSRHRGAFQEGTEYQIDYSQNAVDGNWDGGNYGGNAGQWPNGGGGVNGMYGHQGLGRSGGTWIKEQIAQSGKTVNWKGDDKPWGIPYSGNNKGVSGNSATVDEGLPSPTWKTMLGNNSGTEKNVSYGTSAGNPLILKGGMLTFSCKLEVLTDIPSGSGREALTSAIRQALTGQTITWGGIGTTFSVVAVQNEIVYNINEDLSNGQQIPEGSPLSNLITGVIEEHENIEGDMTSRYKAPLGHFIVKKADVSFGFERDEGFSAINPNYEMLRLCINEIRNVETVTVAKKKFPTSPWFVFTRDFFEGGSPDISAFSYGYGGAYTPDPTPSDPSSLGSPIIEGELNTLADWDYNYNLNETTEPYSFSADFSGFGGAVINVSGDATVNKAQVAGLEDVFITGNASNPGSGAATTPYSVLAANLAQLQDQFFLGFLDFQETEASSPLQRYSGFFRYNRQRTINNLSIFNTVEISPFSVLDGEGGMGGELTHNLTNGGDNIPSLSSAPRRIHTYSKRYYTGGGSSQQSQYYSSAEVARIISLTGAEFTGTINSRFIPTLDLFLQNVSNYAAGPTQFGGFGVGWEEENLQTGQSGSVVPNRSFIPLIQGDPLNGLDNPVGDTLVYPYSYYFNTSGEWPFVINFNHRHSYIEILSQSLILSAAGSSTETEDLVSDRTFKSNANHDFGIVYYDERGRHGFVNHLTTVYVPGYSQVERTVPYYGRSVITLNLPNDFNPPDWAHYYKIAYTKNTTVQNFIQYSVGGAFPPLDDGGLVSSNLIYVSLNYLQESALSYVSDWGARTPQGGLSMFKYIDGGNQKLRVISAYTESNNREYYYNYEFDIVDVVLLGTEAENPLTTTPALNPEMMGEFVILKDNDQAVGFNSSSVSSDNNMWGNNCIVELYTPKKDIEDRFYYEIGGTYNVSSPGESSRAHSVSNITLTKGDVWWRRVPVNLREYDGDFVDLIQYNAGEGETDYSSNFKSYYLETETASDLFKADATLIGRPNIIVEDAVETIREASITYSGKSNPNSSKINYSSFNLTLSNFKELQEEFGDINYMCNMEGDVFVIQSDRCTIVPASKTLFSDVQGSSTVAASTSPLGQEKIFAGRAGCDNNPESVVQVGAYVYFAHKNLGKVYRFNPSNGIQEISEQGMASYFRGIFKAAMDKSVAAGKFINYDDVRVVGGFDPVNEEYLLTVLDPVTYGVTEGTGGGGFPEEGGGVEDLTTINSLEQQLKNVMTAFLTAEDADGNPVFDVSTLPQELQAFYNTPLTDGKDIGAFDGNENDVFDTGEIISVGDISIPMQDAITNLINSLAAPENTDLVNILNAIDDSGITTVAGVQQYINNLESDLDGAVDYEAYINSLVGKASDLTVMLNNSRYASTLLPFIGEADYLSAVQANPLAMLGGTEENGSSIYNLLDNATKVMEYYRLLQTFFGGADRVGVHVGGTPHYSWGNQTTFGQYVSPGTLRNNYTSILTDFQGSLDDIYNTQTLVFENPDTAPMQAVNTFLSNTIQGVISGNALANMQQSDVPDAIVDAINAQFGTNLTIDQIPNTLIETIQSNYITPNVGANDITAFELASANPNLVNQIITNYLAQNPQLTASLESILQGIADDNNVSINEVTGSMLNAWGANFGEGGLYNTVAEAVAGAGISISQLRDLTQQIALSQGVPVIRIFADLDFNNQVAAADLLIFLTAFGLSVDIDYTQNYTNLNLR